MGEFFLVQSLKLFVRFGGINRDIVADFIVQKRFDFGDRFSDDHLLDTNQCPQESTDQGFFSILQFHPHSASSLPLSLQARPVTYLVHLRVNHEPVVSTLKAYLQLCC